MNAILHAEGFLGTSANFAADMTLIISLLVALTFTVGMFLAWRGHYEAHRWVQTTGAIINLILVAWLMLLPFRDFVAADIEPPRERPNFFYAMTIMHAIVGGTALLFGNFVVLRGHNLMLPALKFRRYKPFMRVAYALYMGATLLGVLVYITWFVIVPNPPIFK